MAQYPATISTDKTSYNIGETITLTVTYDDQDRRQAGCWCCSNKVLIDSTPVRNWIKVSDNGKQVIYQSVA